MAFVLVIEEEFNIVTRTFRLHVHGLLQLDPRLKTRKLARKALRSALGTWEGKGKNRQIWLRRDPDCGWPAYFTKRCFLATARMRARMRGFGADHRWVTTFDGPVLTMTNEVRAAARELHAEARQLVINVRRGISQPALKKGVAAPFRPLTATTNPSRAKHVRPSISTSAKIRAAWKLGLRSPRALAALAGRAPAITSVLPSKVLHPWHSRRPPNSLDVPRSYRNPIPAKDPTMPETTPTKRKYTRLSPSKWAEIEALWQVGDLTLSELADAHGVSPRAIQDHMSKRGIIKGSKGAEFAEAVREEIVALELGDKDLTANRAREVRETAYEHARQIEQLVMAQIALAQREPGQILRVASALKGLSLAAGTLERLHGLKYRAMGLDRHVEERELPKLTIDCYTDDELAGIRAQQGEEKDLVGAELVDDAPSRVLGPAPRSRPEDDDVVALGFDDDDDVEEDPTPAAMTVVRVEPYRPRCELICI